jgi:LPS-assembly protein
MGLATPSASPQIGRIVGRAQDPPADTPGLERPDFSVRIPRPNAPPEGEYQLSSVSQESVGGVTKLHGNAVVEMHAATLKADEIEYDENLKVFTARGHVTYRNYDQNELVYCDHAEYNVDTEKGTFYLPKGYGRSRIVAKPGLLTSQEPFYFEGAFVEKDGPKYILHDGFITDCTMPNPWWKLHSTQIDITPEDHALAHNAVYRLRSVPLFYFPVFYKSLKKEPRRSGFLTPHVGHSNTRGFMVGEGYYWAINRSTDLTYEFQDFTTRGYAHHVDFRGKPTQKTDFNLIFYGVQDRGYYAGATLIKAPA